MKEKARIRAEILDDIEVTEINVKAQSYFRFAKFDFKNIFVIILVFLIMCFSQFVYQACIYWVSYWSKQTNQELRYYGEIMGIIVLISYFSTALRAFIFINLVLKSNVSLHKTALESVAGTSSSFFDTNPIGRIVNRFYKDIGVVDGPLQH